MSWALVIIVTALLGLVDFILLEGNLSWQPPPDLTPVVFGGGLALIGTSLVVGLWIWVFRVTLVSRRYGDAELELMNVPPRLGGRGSQACERRSRKPSPAVLGEPQWRWRLGW